MFLPNALVGYPYLPNVGIQAGPALRTHGLSRKLHTNGHGKCAAPDDETCHTRFPLSNFPPKGERANESLREFHFRLINQEKSSIFPFSLGDFGRYQT